jgi:hypothetical protein
MPAALASAEPRGTLKSDYAAASASATPDEALARWREFLQKHEPPNGEYEDAFQRNYIRAAQYELMRISYLTGHAPEGDLLLRRLEDVQSGR